MKRIAALSICLGSVVASTAAGVTPEAIAPASSDWVGDINLQYNYTNLNGSVVGGEDDEFNSAYAEFQLGRNFGDYFVQMDLFGELTDSDDNYQNGFGLAAHVLRNTSFGGLGAFVGAYQADTDNGSDSAQNLFAGVEAQLNRNEANYYFQLGYIFENKGNDSDPIGNAYFGRAVAKTDLTNSLSLAVEIGGAIGEIDGDGDNCTIFYGGLALNQKISDSLVASLSYDYIHYDQADEGDVMNEQIIGLGLTYSFGTGSKSTNLGTPRFLRWAGTTGSVIE
jgi:hypothetical protein